MSAYSTPAKTHLTNEQQSVVDCDFKDVLIVNAYAGTGKTSTLIEFCKARKDKKILYLSYNSSMRAEAEQKFKDLSNVSVKTMHSLAYTELNIKEKYKDRLGSLRAMDIYPAVSEMKKELQNFYATAILNFVRMFCNTSFELKDFLEEVSRDSRAYEINSKMELSYILKKSEILWQDLQNNEKYAYEHDFYLKNYQLSKPKLDYDYILVDEAQDINACVIDIVMRQKAKKVFIGDTYQSIYKFRGAVNSLDLLAKLKDAKILYLTQSFRCPQSISKLANEYLMLLNAPRDFKGTTRIKKSDKKAQNTVICRTNAKLFDIAVNNLDKKLFLVGGVASYNFDELLDVQNLLFKKHEWIKNPFIAKFKDVKELFSYVEETGEIDLKQRIFILFKYIHSDIKKLIKDITKQCVKEQSKAELILSTGHKSKGLEWDNVEIIDDFLNIRQELEEKDELKIAKEELNLLYVAITRAKNSLNISKDYILDEEFITSNKERIVIE